MPKSAQRLFVDEIARVLWDPEKATAFALRLGFPPQHIPRFKTALGFWIILAQSASDGQINGGIQRLIEEAAKDYPDNTIFNHCLQIYSYDTATAPPSKEEHKSKKAFTKIAIATVFTAFTAWLTLTNSYLKPRPSPGTHTTPHSQKETSQSPTYPQSKEDNPWSHIEPDSAPKSNLGAASFSTSPYHDHEKIKEGKEPLTLTVNTTIEAKRESEWIAVDARLDPRIRSGDQIQISISPSKPVYIYVFLHSTGEDIMTTLHPRPGELIKKTPSGKNLILPRENRFFQVIGPPGQERFIIVASPEKDPYLEDIASKLGKNETPQAKTQQRERLIMNLRSVTYKSVTLSKLRRAEPPSRKKKATNANTIEHSLTERLRAGTKIWTKREFQHVK